MIIHFATETATALIGHLVAVSNRIKSRCATAVYAFKKGQPAVGCPV